VTLVTFLACFVLEAWRPPCYLPAYAFGVKVYPLMTLLLANSRRTLGCLLVLAFALGRGLGQNDDPQASKLMVLEHLWNEAQVQRDAHALEGMIADHFVNTEYDGEVSDRQKFLADIADPQFQPTSMTLRDMQVSLYKETAVITGIYHAKGTVGGKPYDHSGRFTDTWVFGNGHWMCVASHTSLLKK
jgi:ketosteroid isomerase-like protein